MKRWICLALAALLLVPAQAEVSEEPSDEISEEVMELEINEVYHLDLDGDGADESLVAREDEEDFDDNLRLLVETDELVYNYETYIMSGASACAADLDGDGTLEILLSGDEASADYFTWCLKFSRDGGLEPLLFADANRGENTGEYSDSGYGRLDKIDGATLTMTGSQDVLGTWMCSREFTLRDGRFELDDGGIWHVNEEFDESEVWEFRCMETVRDLPVILDDGSESVLPPGTLLTITETDKQSYAGFRTRDGLAGKIEIAPNVSDGWGYLIATLPESDYFSYLPYAD